MLQIVPSLPASAAGQWVFKPTGADGKADYSRVALDDSQWTPVQLPHRTWGYEQDKMRAYGWYRQHFTPAQGFE
ncbi:hypothetical protein LLH03_07495, partial [bacterium]|nr:hypothetical protein [bacterium]